MKTDIETLEAGYLEKLRLQQDKMNTYRLAYTDVLKDLPDVTNIVLDASGLDIYATGNFQVLKNVIKVLRRYGYKTTSIVPVKLSAFSAFYYNETHSTARIYFSFTGTVCKQVQVGTKMVEVPIYETVCE